MNVLEEIKVERLKQDAKWGEQNHELLKWNAILGEEFGEVSKAILEGDSENYRNELIQVAAVAVAAIESFDRSSINAAIHGITNIQKIVAETIQNEIEFSKQRNDMLSMVSDDEILIMYDECREWTHSGYISHDGPYFKLADSFSKIFGTAVQNEIKNCVPLIVSIVKKTK